MGMLRCLKALLKQGHRDMLRNLDARMSGTGPYGACILHVAPEFSSVGPTGGWLKTGDNVRMDLRREPLDMLVDEGELATRPRRVESPPSQRFERGWGYNCPTRHGGRPIRAVTF